MFNIFICIRWECDIIPLEKYKWKINNSNDVPTKHNNYIIYYMNFKQENIF